VRQRARKPPGFSAAALSHAPAPLDQTPFRSPVRFIEKAIGAAALSLWKTPPEHRLLPALATFD